MPACTRYRRASRIKVRGGAGCPNHLDKGDVLAKRSLAPGAGPSLFARRQGPRRCPSCRRSDEVRFASNPIPKPPGRLRLQCRPLPALRGRCADWATLPRALHAYREMPSPMRRPGAIKKQIPEQCGFCFHALDGHIEQSVKSTEPEAIRCVEATSR